MPPKRRKKKVATEQIAETTPLEPIKKMQEALEEANTQLEEYSIHTSSTLAVNQDAPQSSTNNSDQQRTQTRSWWSKLKPWVAGTVTIAASVANALA